MPTGYTADVGDGKVTEFSDFALTCARGFGALILLRDSDQSLEATRSFIEEKAYLAKGGYYETEIENATARLAVLEAMSDDEALDAAQARADEVTASNASYNAKKDATRERYEAMLAQTEAWEPPTEDHAKFKEFMVDQLRGSIEFDCSPFAMTVPEVSLMEHRREIERQRDRIARAKREIEEERARNEGRAAWVTALLDSLEGVRNITQPSSPWEYGACTGDAECPSHVHVHGCFRDDGTCDHHSEHDPAEKMGRLQGFLDGLGVVSHDVRRRTSS